MNKYVERLYNGIIKENPTFILMLGMCPTLAVTTSAINGLGMGLSTTIVLALSNMLISLLRNQIPERVRVPSFIVVVASFVTVVDFLLQGFVPSLYAALGIYIPLIVVNCIILGRAESFASKNEPIVSLFDGIGMGLGFSLSLTVIGAIRELIGAGTLFGFTFIDLLYGINRLLKLVGLNITGFIQFIDTHINYTPITIFVLAPGAFFVLGILHAIIAYVNNTKKKQGKNVKEVSGCGNDCSSCGVCGACTTVEDTAEKKAEVQEELKSEE